MQSVGFKEWALVCEALGAGRQSVLLRKGGIAEGRDGFGFRHPEFFLFPTFFHEQVVKVRSAGEKMPEPLKGAIAIEYFAKLEAQATLTAWPEAKALEPFHVLSESVIRERFEYKRAGLAVAFVRIFRLEPSWVFPDRPAYGGCRSWVELPPCPVETQFKAVLSDEEHAAIKGSFRTVVERSGALAPTGIAAPRSSLLSS